MQSKEDVDAKGDSFSQKFHVLALSIHAGSKPSVLVELLVRREGGSVGKRGSKPPLKDLPPFLDKERGIKGVRLINNNPRRHHAEAEVRVAGRVRRAKLKPSCILEARFIFWNPDKVRTVPCCPRDVDRCLPAKYQSLIRINSLAGDSSNLRGVFQEPGNKAQCYFEAIVLALLVKEGIGITLE